MCMQNFIKIYQKVQEIGPASLFSEVEPRQNLDQPQMSFDNLIGYILSISMCMYNFITIFHSVQEIGPFSLFSEFGARQSLDRWKMSFRNLLGQILSISMFTQKFIKTFSSIQEIGPFSLFFRIWRSAKPQPMINVFLQFLGLDLVNINVSAKFYQIIPNGLRVKFPFFFRIWTSAKPRPIPNVIWESHGLQSLSKYSTQFKR